MTTALTFFLILMGTQIVYGQIETDGNPSSTLLSPASVQIFAQNETEAQQDEASESTSEEQDATDNSSSESEETSGDSSEESDAKESSNAVSESSKNSEKEVTKKASGASPKNLNSESVQGLPMKPTSAAFSPEIEWDRPEVKSSKGSKLQIVTFYGHTKKEYKIGLRKKVLWVRKSKKTNKQKIKYLPTKKLRVKGQRFVERDEDGSFRLNLRLPEGEVQIPVTVLHGKERAYFSISVIVEKQKVELQNAELTKNDCRYCLWVGAGVNYLAYQQDPPQNIDNVDYGAFGFPTIMVRGRFEIAKDWKLRAAYNNLGGPELSSPNTVLLNKSISWTHFSLEADYRLISPFRLFGVKFEPAILGGVQMHDMPFLTPVDINNGIFTIDSFKFNSLSGGGMFIVNSNKRLYYEIYMRLQLALSGSGRVTLKSGFAFDGSLGAIYRLNNKVRFGFFWGGQYHTYEYSLEGQDGTYSLLSSKMDFSVGYEF